MLKKFVAIAVAILYSSNPAIAENLNDSISSQIKTDEERFNYKQLIIPSALIAIGAFGVENGWLKHINRDIRDEMSHMRGNCYFHADDFLQYLPAAGYVTIGFIPGAKGQHNFKERLCAGVTAYASMALITNITKLIVKEPRPDTGAPNSFPSGHTATVFTGAELMRLEYGPWIGAAGYTVAVGVGFLRLYNNRHWLNDIIAGAGIGILSAHIGYWLLPFERKLFHISSKAEMAVIPYTDPHNHWGLSLVASF